MGVSSSFLKDTNLKIFKLIGLKDCYMGKTGSVLERNLLSTYDFELEGEEININLIVKEIIPKMLERIEILGKEYELETDNIESSFILVNKNKIFLITSSLNVYEINDFIAIGSGSLVAVGALASNEYLKDTKQKLIQAIEIASKVKASVGAPFIYFNNKDLKFEKIGVRI